MKPSLKLILALLLLSNACAVNAEDLLTIYQQALQFDPMLKSAALQLEMSEAQRGQAGGALLPQLSANVNISANNQIIGAHANTYKGERYSVSLTQAVLDLPKLWNWKRYREIVAQYESANVEAQQTLLYNVVERYFNTLEARDVLDLLEREIASTRKQLAQMQRRFEKQMNKITDVYELEAKLDLLLADEIEAKTQLDIAQQSLTELTGQNITSLALLRSDLEFPAIAGAIDEWVSHAEAFNPGLAAQDKAVSAADNNVLQQQAKHYPVVEMQLNYYNTNTGFQNNLTSLSEIQVAAVNVNVPLFSGGATSKATDEASKSLEINKQKRIALLRTLIKDTRDSFLSTNAGVNRIKAAQKALETSTKAREAMEKGFNYGMQTISDVLVSEEREFKAKRDILQAKYTYIKNRARFERVTGSLTETSLQSINHWLLN